jgi:mannose-6-phosphate isomerase-like protein (cupin superfamily)
MVVIMTYLKDTGEISAVHHPAAGVESAEMRTGAVARFTAPGSATEGRFGLFEWNMAPRAGGPEPHFHKTFSESFYIIAGTVRLYDGSAWVEAAAGDFLYVPEGGVHAFRNDGDEDARMLILFAPGAPRERYFRELAEYAASGQHIGEDEIDAFLARHDQYRAGPA